MSKSERESESGIKPVQAPRQYRRPAQRLFDAPNPTNIDMHIYIDIDTFELEFNDETLPCFDV